MHTFTYIALSVLPMLACLLACLVLVPLLLMHAACRPMTAADDVQDLQPWDEVLADLDAPESKVCARVQVGKVRAMPSACMAHASPWPVPALARKQGACYAQVIVTIHEFRSRGPPPRQGGV